jgi:hypothetical protein
MAGWAQCSSQVVKAIPVPCRPVQDGQNDIVLHSLELVSRAEIDGGGGAKKVHSFRTNAGPGLNILEIEAAIFLLKKYSHTLPAAPHQFLQTPQNWSGFRRRECSRCGNGFQERY